MSQMSPRDAEVTSNLVEESETAATQRSWALDSRPPLLSDGSFWGMIVTQFLGAFNDNLYKQLMLLLAIPAAAAATAAGDIQGWATFVFSIPFVIFSGFAGYLSDRYSKTPIIVYCKVAEIVTMFLGLMAFYFFDFFQTPGTWVVLFLMGAQSAFFGPGKYGVLPELFRPADLPRANGLMLMTTFLAIIFGTVMAGGLKTMLAADEDNSASSLWPGLLVCMGIAVVGTLTSLLVRRTPPAQPNSTLTYDSLAISRDMYHLLSKDRMLLAAILVSSIFWLVSGIAVPAVNRLGLGMLKASDLMTSALSASIAIGIMGGALLASLLCRKGYGDRSVTWGLFGIFACLVALGFWTNGNPVPAAANAPQAADMQAANDMQAADDMVDAAADMLAAEQPPAAPAHRHLLGFGGSVTALILLGVFAAVFAIPIQVFLQDRPPAELKGRMIATMNQANFMGILISGPLYQLFEAISTRADWAISSVFWMMSLLVLPAALIYRLDSAKDRPSGK